MKNMKTKRRIENCLFFFSRVSMFSVVQQPLRGDEGETRPLISTAVKVSGVTHKFCECSLGVGVCLFFFALADNSASWLVC